MMTEPLTKRSGLRHKHARRIYSRKYSFVVISQLRIKVIKGRTQCDKRRTNGDKVIKQLQKCSSFWKHFFVDVTNYYRHVKLTGSLIR